MASNQMQLTRAADDTSELRDDRTVRTGTIGTAYNAEEVDEQIRHAREALALCSDHKEIMMDAYSILAGLLCLRSQHEDDVRSVEEAISMQRQALTLCPERNRNRMVSCGNLAVSLKTHYKRLGDIRFLNEAIDLEREALTLCPTTVHHRWAFCSNLADSLETYCEYTSDVRFLDEAISLHREALDICLDHGLGQAYSYGNLAISLMKLYQRTDDPRLLDEAIDLGRKNFHLCPVGDPNRLSACQNLALSLKSLYERTANDHLMAEIMGLEHEALSLCSEENLDDSFHNLACSCEMHYQRTGNVQALDAAIHLARQVLDQCRPRDPKGSSFCTHLSSLLNMRFNITGDVLLLNEAIDFQRVAFIISSEGGSSEGGPDYPWSCTNMADLLMNRHRVTGDLRLLDEAVALAREALSLCPKGHPYRSASCHSLAISLWMCYDRSRDRKCLDEAIDLERESFDIDSAKYPNKSSSVANLATFLSQRYKHTGDINIINEAINLQRKALDTVPEGHPERASYCGNLTSVLCIYYDGCGDEALLHEIHALEQEAVTIAPVRSVWSHLCYLAWVHLHKNSSFYDVNKAISYLSRSLEKEHDDIVEVLLQVRPLLDCLWTCHAEEKHIKLTPIYLRVVNLLPPLVHPVIRVQSQLSSMGQCNTIGSDAFVNAALAGNAVLGLENLELVQGVIWSQGLHRRDPQLADVPEPLAHRLQELLQNLKIGLPLLKEPILSSRYESLHFYSAQLHVLVSEIRALPGLERFMLGETFETLRIVASTHPVVVLVSARNHFYAFIITASQPQRHLLLPLDLTDEDLQSISYISGSTTAFRAAVETEDTGSELERGMNKTLSTHSGPLDRQLITLWHKIVKPVLDCLGFEPSHGEDRPRLHWCPTGIFSAVPLHAAGVYDGRNKVCCADYVVSSYTPTVTTLLRAQRAASTLSRSNLSVVLVAEKRPQDRTLQTIYGVEKEIEHVSTVAKLSNIKVSHRLTGSTTVAGTATAMQTANIVHLACHGIQDVGDATQSGFCLGDGRLTITELMELKLDSAFLAFLSACETAKGDKNQPDQVMHLAAAMLFSGFKNVVATMWAIADDDGPNIAKWFYEELFSKDVVDADGVAYALDVAVGKLRASGVPSKRWAPFIHIGA